MGLARKKVIVTTNSFYGAKVKLLEEMGVEVQFLPDRADPRFLSEIETAHALIPGLTPVTSQIMEKAPCLVIVAAHGVGYNNIDLQAADEMGILVTNIPGVNADAVAEFTFGLILALIRRIPHAWEEMRRGGWRLPEFWGFDLRGKALSIIGLGRIGSRVSKLGVAFGMEVLACDPYLPDQAFRGAGAKPVSRQEAISRADFLTLHTPLTEETRMMIGSRELSLMKESALLINTARGGIVDDGALVKALDDGFLAGAGIDVFETEPPADPTLRSHPKIISTPHIAGLSDEARYRMSRGASERVACALRGERPPDVVNEPRNPRYLRMGREKSQESIKKEYFIRSEKDKEDLMPKRMIQNLEELRKMVGQEVGVSDWHPVTQQAINMFADATLDHQWIHIDVERAKRESPFGGPIAHGYYTLSLAPYLLANVMDIKEKKMGVNYGLNKLRFTSPVPVPSKVRVRATLALIEEIKGGVQATFNLQFEVEGKDKPACVAEAIYRYYA